ncbi:hypothetical protein ACFYQQ_00975 [Streptomyces sp. NPDC005496]|uniref:hypothetical protein n=1 Tax=unclassified Streptomyces TaxID=2593676 RepID=UPI0033BC5179
MFGLVFRRTHLAELAAAHAETNRLRAERNQAVEEREAFKAASITAARQLSKADALKGEPRIEGGLPRRTPLTKLLRESRAHAAALEQRLAEVTAANQRCTCGGAS